jgi:hypothetical protein
MVAVTMSQRLAINFVEFGRNDSHSLARYDEDLMLYMMNIICISCVIVCLGFSVITNAERKVTKMFCIFRKDSTTL